MNLSFLTQAARSSGQLSAKRRMMLSFLTLCIVATTAPAQSGGDLLWSVNVAYTPQTAAPRVSADGTIYFHSDDLYSISPAGQIIWTKASSDPHAVDIGLDGTVYSGSGSTIFAYTSTGTLKWSFTEPPGGQGLMAGPTVGPDGNVYAVTDLGGLGAMALTPTGQLLWNVPGFGNIAGTGLTTVPVTTSRLYFAEDIVPGCAELQQGISAVDLGGHLQWCDSISGVSRAVASPSGDALVHDFGVLYDYNPDGSLDWSFTFPFPSGTLIGPSVGSNGTIYIFHSYTNLWSLTSNATKRWETDGVAGSNFPVEPTVSPDGSTVVFATVFSFGVNGNVVAVNANDGSILWSVPISGPSAGAAGPVAFSNDSETVYVPITEIGGVNKLQAYSVHGETTGPVLTVTGACPGAITISVAGTTPGAQVSIYGSKRAGSTTITTGNCAGTTLDLMRARVIATGTSDANGNVMLRLRLNARQCGQLMQALDLTTCASSNVASAP
jgi:outer membrane protein assembly factor BamB